VDPRISRVFIKRSGGSSPSADRDSLPAGRPQLPQVKKPAVIKTSGNFLGWRNNAVFQKVKQQRVAGMNPLKSGFKSQFVFFLYQFSRFFFGKNNFSTAMIPIPFPRNEKRYRRHIPLLFKLK